MTRMTPVRYWLLQMLLAWALICTSLSFYFFFIFIISIIVFLCLDVSSCFEYRKVQ